MPTPAKMALCDLPDWPALMDRVTAAAYLDVGPEHFRRKIAPDLKAVRVGDTRYPRSELDAWIKRNARRTLEAA